MLTKTVLLDNTDNLHSNIFPSYTVLRERDWEALKSLFDRDDGEEIEADIKHKLSWLVPEPCWEDNPFEFLREFL
jgi:hypothetical protein